MQFQTGDVVRGKFIPVNKKKILETSNLGKLNAHWKLSRLLEFHREFRHSYVWLPDYHVEKISLSIKVHSHELRMRFIWRQKKKNSFLKILDQSYFDLQRPGHAILSYVYFLQISEDDALCVQHVSRSISSRAFTHNCSLRIQWLSIKLILPYHYQIPRVRTPNILLRY